MVEEVLVWVVDRLVREIVSGSLGLSKSSEKTYHTVSHSFSNSFSITLYFWSAWKEKDSRGDEDQGFDSDLDE